mmetsp:Transcript_10004/g.11632  ORF Transcript_10004/g.11632 Transcript_10004/m.11632 type:complete len:115 (+) Transcript_10004:137-481(+)
MSLLSLKNSLVSSSGLDNFFMLGFSFKFQLLALIISLWDKLSSMRVFPFRLFGRVPEQNFSLLSFLGAGPGCICSFYILNHKTNRRKNNVRYRVIAYGFLGTLLKGIIVMYILR